MLKKKESPEKKSCGYVPHDAMLETLQTFLPGALL
jgi:hypothetical protein